MDEEEYHNHHRLGISHPTYNNNNGINKMMIAPNISSITGSNDDDDIEFPSLGIKPNNNSHHRDDEEAGDEENHGDDNDRLWITSTTSLWSGIDSNPSLEMEFVENQKQAGEGGEEVCSSTNSESSLSGDDGIECQITGRSNVDHQNRGRNFQDQTQQQVDEGIYFYNEDIDNKRQIYKDDTRRMFQNAKAMLDNQKQSSYFFRWFVYLYAERKLVVLFWIHFICTMIIWCKLLVLCRGTVLRL